MRSLTGNQDKVVNLIFVRHGLSCVNALAMLQEDFATFDGALDPPLCSLGVQRTRENGKELLRNLEKVDIVFSSMLTRAAETAHFLFEDTDDSSHRVILAPYLREQGGDHPWSSPRDLPDQMGRLQGQGVDADYRYSYNQEWRRSEGNLMKFIAWLGPQISSIIRTQKPTITVLVVSHGATMEMFLRQYGNMMVSPFNNEAWCASLTLINDRLIFNRDRPFKMIKYPLNVSYPKVALRESVCKDSRCEGTLRSM